MNESILAFSFIGLFLIFYLCLRPFYVRHEMKRMMDEIKQEVEREEFPDFIDVEEDCVESENDKDIFFDFPYNIGLTPDAGKQSF